MTFSWECPSMYVIYNKQEHLHTYCTWLNQNKSQQTRNNHPQEPANTRVWKISFKSQEEGGQWLVTICETIEAEIHTWIRGTNGPQIAPYYTMVWVETQPCFNWNPRIFTLRSGFLSLIVDRHAHLFSEPFHSKLKQITFSQPYKAICTSEVVRICSVIIFHLSKLKSQLLHTVWSYFWWGCRRN